MSTLSMILIYHQKGYANYSNVETVTTLNRFLGLENVLNSKAMTVSETYKPIAIIDDSLILNKEDKKINVHTEIMNCDMVESCEV